MVGCDNYTGVGRIVGLDVGERRIGVAVSDPTRTLARPVTTLHTTGLDGNALQISLDEITRLTAEDPLDAVVVGLPRRLDGSASALTPRIERFATRLRERAGLAVILQDERLSSVEAESRLAAREKNWRVRKEQLDAAAAAVILQDYLDAHPRGIDTDPSHP